MKAILCGLLLALPVAAADWPQWRGPFRDGSSASSVPLADSWPEDGPKLLWESEIVPSGDDGGDKRVDLLWDRQVGLLHG